MPAISYTLALDGSPLDAAVIGKLRKVECEEHADLADLLRLTFTLTRRDNNSGWAVLDDDVFTRLAKLRLSITVGSNNAQPIMEGYVIEVAAEYGNDPANNLLSVVAFDSSVLMNLEEKARAWSGMADSDIASAIFGEYGFSSDVTDTQPTRAENVQTVVQRGSDIQFLRTLARRNGYECYVDLDAASGQPTGHFHPPKYDATPQGTLSIGMGRDSTIETLRIRYDLLRPASTSIANLDVYASDTQTATVSSVAATSLGSTSTLGSDRPRKLLVNPNGLTEAGELQTYAQAVTDRTALAIRAEGELNAQAYQGVLRAKRPVLVRGVGRELSGTYYVERVLHSFEASSYKQSFTLRRNATGVAGQEDFTTESS
jgi:phage protein D